jgi:uncharacterized membrane protein/protein-disulfide isomerase
VPTPSRTRAQPRGTPDAAPASRALPFVLLLLAIAGIGVAIDLWLIHERAQTGGRSFCDISATVNCTDVARSKYAVLLHVPLAAWGALAYLAIAGLAGSALSRRRPGASWPAGLLLVLTGAMVLGAGALAAISEFVLHRFCVMCAVSWAITLALFAFTIPLVRRAGGAGAALGADLAALKAHRGAALGSVAALAAIAIALLAVYPRTPAIAKEPGRGLPPSAIAVIPPGPPGSLVIYEYSDYLCPHCAVMNREEKPIVARRPDVRFVRRHYPLDNTCNPQLPQQVHAGSCDLARGAICAERQGKFELYDDLAFANQEARPKPEAVAQQAGLDLTAFRDCLSSPETEQRLAADIQAAGQANVNFTPALQVQGKIYSLDMLYPLLGLPPRAQ